MYFSQLSAYHVRNFDRLDICPGKRINLFYGDNASGKTAILETIYFLARVRSFRTLRVEDVIKNGAEQMSIQATLCGKRRRHVLGLEKGRSYTKIRMDQKTMHSSTDQVRRLPVLALLPESSNLYTGSPRARRRWLDWSLFYMRMGFLDDWKAYHRALRHRNASLKGNGHGVDLSFWEQIMGVEAEKIDKERRQYIDALNDYINRIFSKLLPGPVEVLYKRGWQAEKTLAENLESQRELDRARGYTQSGPHRGDITFRIHGKEVPKILSRGEMKLYSASLLMGQARQISERTGKDPLILIDDFDAELDKKAQARLFDEIEQRQEQYFITTLNKLTAVSKHDGDNTVFHVKHNTVASIG